MSNDPDQIREQIETTRVELRRNVDTLTDRVNPRRVASERADRVRGRLGRVKDKVMGSAMQAREVGGQRASGTGQRVSGTAHQASGALAGAAHRASDTASSAADRARAMPQMTRERTEGAPLAAGLIAFGVGLLASSLIPPSEPERRLSGQAKQKAKEHSGEIKQQAGAMTHRVQEDLRGPAQQAAQSIKSKATESASAVQDQGRTAARQVQGQVRESRDDQRR
ncbi:DUF3618 domain-containing protein [Micromonospora sp. H33]|uniref:DUF3618 domain-containing protein n=1 Tax=Micromonospora sp. H33 TaxID=3452215 RepID=UPI003F8AF7D6